MTGPLSLVRIRTDIDDLVRWGVAERYFPQQGSDTGYMLHAALLQTLGELAPRPFVHHRPDEILGYVAAPAEDILDLCRGPDQARHLPAKALRPRELEARAMPDRLPADARYAFRLRARPIVRVPRDDGTRRNRDADAAQARIRRALRDGEPPPPAEQAYREWLGRTLAKHGARLVQARVLGHSRTQVLRRQRDNRARRISVPGPDVSFAGTLAVEDPGALRRGLTAGIGRHAAFGFGCLLLAPAKSGDASAG